MDAASLLSAYAAQHDACRRTGDFAPLAALFADDAALVFHGIPFPALHGRAAIERAFRERGPGDDLVLGGVVLWTATQASAVYGWAAQREHVAGTLRLAEERGRIARLDVFAIVGGPQVPRRREAVRAVVLTPQGRVLLVRCREPKTSFTWWITPGGGREPGETREETLRRELLEEVGIEADPAACPCLWTREHTFTWGDHAVRQRESFLLVRMPGEVAVAPRLDAPSLAREGLDLTRWWSADEIRAAPFEVFAPRAFASLLEAVVRDGPPAEPLDVGV